MKFAFQPRDFSLLRGTQVTWTNNDTFTHTVTSSSGPGSFNSGDLASGQSFTFTFNQPGTYTYGCTHHLSMKGRIVVQP